MLDLDSAYQEHELYGPVSLCTPAVRMVAIKSWAWEDEHGEMQAGHEFRPIVALRSVVRHRYTKRRLKTRDRFEEFRTHRELIKAGWSYAGTSAGVVAIVCVEGLLEGAYDELMDGDPTCCVFTCPWPPEEDETRLAEDIAKLHKDAIQKEQSCKKVPV